jgi:pyruvate,orthophosphate dikinase
MAQVERRVYRFGSDVVDGDGTMKNILGGKGAGLAEMTALSVPVPPGFTITIDVCRHYLEHGTLPAGLSVEIDLALKWLEVVAGKQFGDSGNPLLVSVRSGAPISMPGMMDTILNVGLNDGCVRGLARKSGSERFAFDSYRRLIQMFGSVVLGVHKHAFEEAFEAAKLAEGEEKTEPSATVLRRATKAFKSIIQERTGHPFPQDPKQQLMVAVEAVFQSWCSDRACYYRRLNGISDELGTAVTVQMMVFGNHGPDSGTGVGFTRNPSTGENAIFAEFLPNAQGEDIVAGTRTPMSIIELARTMPAVYEELKSLTTKLELHYRDAQDFEFTIESGKLYILQTRSAKRAALAAVQIAVDMVSEGLISRYEAIHRVKPSSIIEIMSPQLDFSHGQPILLGQGLSASPGAAVGQIALTAIQATSMAAAGDTVILVTEETTADDIHGMAVSAGFLTARGGATSHAAVVARGMGKCCITGAKSIRVDANEGLVHIGERSFRAGDWLSLDGSTGRIFEGSLATKAVTDNNVALDTLLSWSRNEGTCAIRANADTPEDASNAKLAGAVGIGLCRTEHMFFASDRLRHVRKMILATTTKDRIEALELLLPMQQDDFEKLFRTMSPLPVTIRLLDPPLHEFLPSTEEIDDSIKEARKEEDWEQCASLEATLRRVQLLTEANPMMGHRGCRLSLTYPEILHMQVRAILQAALVVAAEGLVIVPEIMVPLVASEEEMRVLARMIHETAAEVCGDQVGRIPYRVGTMIELPRAAVCAGSIAKHVSFISFGTNDLTQMTFGFSRDDARTYLDSYLEQGILKVDPFITIDQEGVGQLMAMAVKSVREVDPTIKIGVCGEHGGDPESINFFHSLGLDYVSCSPSRIPVAQLASAQAGDRSSAQAQQLPCPSR